MRSPLRLSSSSPELANASAQAEEEMPAREVAAQFAIGLLPFTRVIGRHYIDNLYHVVNYNPSSIK
jgi:hypothetical protein